MENDLSDEAYRKWHDEIAVPTIQLLATYTSAKFAEAAWEECRRRAESRERETFEAGYNTGVDHGGHRWGNIEIAWKEYNDRRASGKSISS